MPVIIVHAISWLLNIQGSEPEAEPTVNPTPYPYITERGLSHCYLMYAYTSVRRNGTDVHYCLVQDAYNGQYRRINENALIINSWFTMRRGVQ